MRISFLIILIFLLSSCATSLREERSVPQQKPIYAIAKQLQSACSSTTKPSFLAIISSLQNKIPPFQIEGAWKENNSILQMNILGVLGETYGQINLTSQGMSINFQNNPFFNSEKFQQFLDLITALQPQGMRDLFCGANIFFSDQNQDPVYYNTKKDLELAGRTQQESYLSKTEVNYKKGKISVQNDISTFKRDDNLYELDVKSDYHYGYFNNIFMTTRWLAVLNKNQTVEVKKIAFKVQDEEYLVNFLDYN